MKKILIFAFASIILISCSKYPEHAPEISKDYIYKDLNNFEVNYNHPITLDLNNDGTIDYSIAASIIDDNYLIDKLEFTAFTLHGSQLYNNNHTPKAFDKGEMISTTSTTEFAWDQRNAFIAKRVYTEDPSRPVWEGAWADKTDKYLGVKVKSGESFYTGWIRISTGGLHSKIIIHDYALSKKPGIEIKAGEVK